MSDIVKIFGYEGNSTPAGDPNRSSRDIPKSHEDISREINEFIQGKEVVQMVPLRYDAVGYSRGEVKLGGVSRFEEYGVLVHCRIKE